MGDVAFHVRRRLSAVEEARIGPALDIRGTPEARQRAMRLGGLLLLADPEILGEELGHQ